MAFAGCLEDVVHAARIGFDIGRCAGSDVLQSFCGRDARLVVDAYAIRARPAHRSNGAKKFAAVAAAFVAADGGGQCDTVFVCMYVSELRRARKDREVI